MKQTFPAPGHLSGVFVFADREVDVGLEPDQPDAQGPDEEHDGDDEQLNVRESPSVYL
jgi:hypothetical protein